MFNCLFNHLRKNIPITYITIVISLMIAGDALPAYGADITPVLERAADGLEAKKVVLAPKALQRQHDLVTVTGEQLNTLIGKEIANLRLYAYTEEKFRPIPYQIDERNPEGEFIFSGGQLAGEDIDKGKFDVNDELIFVCGHAGDRVDRVIWPQGSSIGHEIVISDPRDFNQKSWAYLIYFPQEVPAPALEDYLNYDPEVDRVKGKYYTVGYKKGYGLFTDLIYPEASGGNNQDFLDRLKIRIDVQLMGGMVHIRRTEADIRCEVIGWKDGPIRVIRNTEMRFRILFNIPSPSLFSVTEYYPHYFTVPMRFSIPFNLKWVMNSFVVKGFAFYMYGDFLPNMIGGAGYTNHNPEGLIYTGHTPVEEAVKKFDLSGLAWGYFTKKDVGIWCARMNFPDAFLQFFNVFFRDDISMNDPPEDAKGVHGGGAYVLTKSLAKKMGTPDHAAFINPDLWEVVQKGTMELGIDTYMSSIDLQPDELESWMAIRDYPLWIEVSQEKSVNKQIAGEMDQSLIKAVLFDRKGRQIHLRDLYFHIGSPRTTGWEHVIGYEIPTNEWHIIPLKEISRIDFDLQKGDFAAGRPSRQFLNITRKDKSVVKLLNAKCASFAGHIDTDEKIFIWNPWIEKIELRD